MIPPAEVTAAGAALHDAAREVGAGRPVATIADPDCDVLGVQHR